MREFPFVCTCCEFSAPSANELAAHLQDTHEPIAVEDLTEFVRRGMAASAALEEAVVKLGEHPIDELREEAGRGARLEQLRTAAAESIAAQRRPRLVEVHAELQALQVSAAETRDRMARISWCACESLAAVERVLEILPEQRR